MLPPVPAAGAADAEDAESIEATASVTTRKLHYNPDSYRPTKDDFMPTGTIKKDYTLRVSGMYGFHHTEYHMPDRRIEMNPERRFGETTYLPGGRVVMADGIGNHGDQNFGFWRWDFLNLGGSMPGVKGNVNLVRPSIVVASATREGEGWGAAELHLRRYVSSPPAPPKAATTVLRVKRVAGDPYAYLLIRVPEKEAKLEGISLMVLNRGDPSHLWFGGKDWLVNQCKGQPIKIDDDAKAGAIWYNGETNQDRGCCAVFLPEEAPTAKAWGSYDGALSLSTRGPLVRLALYEWNEPRGWKAAVEPFIRELPERVERLRQMDFSWPSESLMTESDNARIDTLLASLTTLYPPPETGSLDALDEAIEDLEDDTPLPTPDGLPSQKTLQANEGGEPDPEALRDRVKTLLSQYKKAAAALEAIPRATTPERIAAEQRVVLLKYEIDAALQPALKKWLAMGGVFANQ